MFSWLTKLLVAWLSITKVLNQKSRKKVYFLFFCFFRWGSPKLREIYHNSFQLTLSSFWPHCFSKFHKVFVTTHSITMASFEVLFLRICKNSHMATKLWTGTSSGECCQICFKQHLGTKKKIQTSIKNVTICRDSRMAKSRKKSRKSSL